MSVRSVSLSSMFGWIVDAFRLVRKNLPSLMAASGLMLLLIIIMCLPMWLVMLARMKTLMTSGGVQSGAMALNDTGMFYGMYGLSLVLGVLLFPPMLVGWFRLFRNLDQGNSVRAMDVFAPYQDKQLWLRSIGFALLAAVVYFGVFGLFAMAFYGAFADVMQQLAAQQAAALAGATPAPPSFPAGFFFAYFGFIGIAMLLQFVYMLGFAEIALRPTGAIEAMKLALLGVFRNVLKLIAFMACAFFVFCVAFFFLALVIGLLVVALSFINKALGMLMVGFFYLLLVLCVYPLMFAGGYLVWKSVLGADEPTLAETSASTLSA